MDKKIIKNNNVFLIFGHLALISLFLFISTPGWIFDQEIPLYMTLTLAVLSSLIFSFIEGVNVKRQLLFILIYLTGSFMEIMVNFWLYNTLNFINSKIIIAFIIIAGMPSFLLYILYKNKLLRLEKLNFSTSNPEIVSRRNEITLSIKNGEYKEIVGLCNFLRDVSINSGSRKYDKLQLDDDLQFFLKYKICLSELSKIYDALYEIDIKMDIKKIFKNNADKYFNLTTASTPTNRPSRFAG